MWVSLRSTRSKKNFLDDAKSLRLVGAGWLESQAISRVKELGAVAQRTANVGGTKPLDGFNRE
jgi:predicted RecA/RadA family phage recombinase